MGDVILATVQSDYIAASVADWLHHASFPALRNVTQRNATQVSRRNKKALRNAYFFTQPQTPGRRLRLLAARKQI